MVTLPYLRLSLSHVERQAVYWRCPTNFHFANLEFLQLRNIFDTLYRMQELIMLGTGHATVTQCYNTCFALRHDDSFFLVDAGGGNGILRQLDLAHIPFTGLKGMMITHAHTDHILGAVWIVRYIATLINKGDYQGNFLIYGHKEALPILDWICQQCLPAKLTKLIGQRILLNTLEAGDTFPMLNCQARCFDLHSRKMKQFGFEMNLPQNQRLVCMGDEPPHPLNFDKARHAQWLLSEAFCLHAHADIFKPYEKYHSTALDAGKIAAELEVKNLLLYHTEDKYLTQRKELYTEEAQQHFTGAIFVPDDLERISLV